MIVPLKRKTTRPIYTVTAHRWKLAPLATLNGRHRKENNSTNNKGGVKLLPDKVRHAFSHLQD